VAGCWTGDRGERNDLSKMLRAKITIKGHAFDVAVAATLLERQLGLMNLPPEAFGQDEGMLFVFPHEQPLGFWMKNTRMPLDLAYISAAGRIVRIHTMRAMDTSTYFSGSPVRFALEVHAGRLAALGIGEGDLVEIPESLLKP